jgi:replication fork clamp-binding protein CrfC
MIEDKRNEWRLLCKQTSTEQDFEKLLELTNEILRLTDPRLKRFQPPPEDNDC